ncbi:MAG: hypothetical protein NC131_13265 [Roseburia sp.]|nr:hypothetical protein [Butyrivibrio sp.]MCM1440153.1 hypothetical protein [Roseburia sp.]
MNLKKDTTKWILSWGVIAIGVLIYFELSNPIYMYTVDDWINIVNRRYAIPDLKTRNPGKILPETLFPVVGELARWIIYPLNHDFISAITIMSGIMLTALVIIYFYEVLTCIAGDIHTNGKIILLFCIVLLHFDLYKNSTNMFSNSNLTDMYHYLAVYLINASVVCHFIKRENGSEINAIELLLIYLCFFSNMFQSILLAVYAFFRMVRDIYLDENKKISNICIKNSVWILCLIVWVIDLIFEKNGKRRYELTEGGAQFDIIASAKACFNTYMTIREEIKISLLILGIIAIVLYIRKNTTKHIIKNLFIHRKFGILILSAFTAGIYLLLLDAYANAGHYLNRQDVYNTILFYPGIILLIGVRYVIKNMRVAYCVMPILIYIMMFQSVFHSSKFYHYRENMNMKNFECQVIQEMIEADQNGIKELQIITTREFVDEASKPWLEEMIPDVLYRYGVVYDWITLEFFYE